MKPVMMSILFLIAKLTKFVSTITWNGGPSWLLYLRNIAEEVRGLKTQGVRRV